MLLKIRNTQCGLSGVRASADFHAVNGEGSKRERQLWAAQVSQVPFRTKPV